MQASMLHVCFSATWRSGIIFHPTTDALTQAMPKSPLNSAAFLACAKAKYNALHNLQSVLTKGHEVAAAALTYKC